ncbi:MAG: hypothetical protein ABWK53_06705 [Anaerolineales bacterium]
MNRRNRTQLGMGIILILAAAWMIASRLVPDLSDLFAQAFTWPMWIILAGAAMLLFGLLVGAPGMAVPACIVAGIGGILYYYEATNNWDEWYFWLLIPGFVGVGSLLSGLLGGTFRQEVRGGLNTIFVSLVLFAIFAALVGKAEWLGPYTDYLPIGLLFFLGLWLILGSLLRRPRVE